MHDVSLIFATALERILIPLPRWAWRLVAMLPGKVRSQGGCPS